MKGINLKCCGCNKKIYKYDFKDNYFTCSKCGSITFGNGYNCCKNCGKLTQGKITILSGYCSSKECSIFRKRWIRKNLAESEYLRNRKYYLKNKNKILKYSNQYFKDNREKSSERYNLYMKVPENRKKQSSRVLTYRAAKLKYIILENKCKNCGKNDNSLEIHHEVYPNKTKEIINAFNEGKIYQLCYDCHGLKSVKDKTIF